MPAEFCSASETGASTPAEKRRETKRCRRKADGTAFAVVILPMATKHGRAMDRCCTRAAVGGHGVLSEERAQALSLGSTREILRGARVALRASRQAAGAYQHGTAGPWRDPDSRRRVSRLRALDEGRRRHRAATGGGRDGRGLRIALYSHDTMGLGHTRRNLLLAKALADSPLRPTVLVIAGAREGGVFDVPAGVDSLILPALFKEADGQYRSRSLRVSLAELAGLRANCIRGAVKAFCPDALIVDQVPRGAAQELEPTLELLRSKRNARCILGLRDVVDEPATVQRQWRRARNLEAVRRYYDAVWVYGDPGVYDLVSEYGLPADFARKVSYTGYLDPRVRLGSDMSEGLKGASDGSGRLAICLVGGGQDGGHLAEVFARARMPRDLAGLIVTGPFMPAPVRERLHRQASLHSRLRVLEFVKEPASLLRRADRVVAMGGYNTVCELLALEKRALIVPRVSPRREQLVRAERLSALGLLEVLPPDRLTANNISAWLAQEGEPPRARERIDLHGLDRVQGLLSGVLAAGITTARDVSYAAARLGALTEEVRHVAI